MKFLFSVGVFGKYPIANNVLQIRLADQLSEMGHHCIVVGISNDTCKREETKRGTQLIHLPLNRFLAAGYAKLERFEENNPQKNRQAFLLRYPFSALKCYAFTHRWLQRRPVKRYARIVRHMVIEERIDVVIGFTYPFEYAEEVLLQDMGSTKKLYYQFDPHGMNQYLPESSRNKRVFEETAVITASDFTFTTRALLREYAAHKAYQTLLDKITAEDFPLIEPPQDTGACAFSFVNGDINILFSGNLDERFRQPDYILSLLEKVFQKHRNVKLFFLGWYHCGKLEEMAKQHPDNIFLHGYVGAQDSATTIAHADILLNIGNAVSNMVPSKIFAYFATGKPIIQVQKIPDSPDQEYFARYPLVFTVPEYSEKDVSAALERFILQERHSVVPYATIEQLYQTATPLYVAEDLVRATDGTLRARNEPVEAFEQ